MRKHVVRFLPLLLWSLAGRPAVAQALDVPRHEVWLGFGGATSLGKRIFNVPDDIKSRPERAASLGYMYKVNTHWAVGVNAYGTTEETPRQLVADLNTGLVTPAVFTLVTGNLGFRARYTFLRATIAPYVYAGFNYARGVITSAPTGSLSYSGASECIGPGASMTLGRSWKLSAEGMLSSGSAYWREAPFLNSTGRKFDPSLMSGMVHFSYQWGR